MGLSTPASLRPLLSDEEQENDVNKEPQLAPPHLSFQPLGLSRNQEPTSSPTSSLGLGTPASPRPRLSSYEEQVNDLSKEPLYLALQQNQRSSKEQEIVTNHYAASVY